MKPTQADLTKHLHSRFIANGETTGAAEMIADYEQDNACEFTAGEIIKATRDAGESFVDSMVNNEHDTEEDRAQYPDLAPLSDRVAYWEKMRPSVIRHAAIKTILAGGTTTAATIAKNAGECPATNTGRHHVKQGANHCHKCGAR